MYYDAGHLCKANRTVDVRYWRASSVKILNNGTRGVKLFDLVEMQVPAERVLHTPLLATGNSVISPSWTHYLRNYVGFPSDLTLEQLESGALELRQLPNAPNYISLFPVENLPHAVTRDIHVSVSVARAIVRSDAFTYSIRIWMPAEVPRDLTAQAASAHWELTTRYWRIRHVTLEQTEIVEGPGVVLVCLDAQIGLYPHMHPGADFRYESACIIRGRQTLMEGHFNFRNSSTGEDLAVAVPQFLMDLDSY